MHSLHDHLRLFIFKTRDVLGHAMFRFQYLRRCHLRIEERSAAVRDSSEVGSRTNHDPRTTGATYLEDR